MVEKIKYVEKFHDTFKIGNRYKPTANVGEEEYMLRYNLIKEENEEYLEACKNGDIVEIADALGDQLYILFGTILRQNGQPIFREDGKILKSNLYFKPNIKAILEK